MDEKDLNENEEKLTDVNNDSVIPVLNKKTVLNTKQATIGSLMQKRRRLMKILLWKIKTIQFRLTK
ncbi:MAG: hypothetical protein ACM67P_01915 [Clostridiales bacterium]